MDGAKQKETISANESISFPKALSESVNLAILPSKESKNEAKKINPEAKFKLPC